MGKASIQVKFEMPKYFNALQDNLQRIERTIASTIQTQVGLRFDAEGAHNGHEPWKPLVMRQGQILSFTGTLRKSLSPPGAEGNPGPQGFVRATGPVMDFNVEVGTKVLYASVHDQGAIIVPSQKRALRFKNMMTGKFVFSQKSVIPKRSFTDLNDQDNKELEETLTALVADILNGAET